MDPRLGPVIRFGTPEPAPVPVPLTAGPLSVEWIAGVPRRLAWHGIEVIRGIDCPIRDEGWGTHPAETPVEEIETGDGRFTVRRSFAVGGGAVSCRLTFTGRAGGIFRATAEIEAHRDFSTNRAGFVILHPVSGLSGAPVMVTRPDGSSAPSFFPRMISPGQPVFDIAGLAYSLQGVETAITFEGETFEMEDQRNWTDASYKTYCRPLSRPWPYGIAAGEIIRQGIEIRVRGVARRPAAIPANHRATPSAAGSQIAGTGLRVGPAAGSVPRVALALDRTSLPNPEEARVTKLAGIRILRLRVRPETLDGTLEAARGLLQEKSAEVDLEVVVPGGRPVDGCLGEIAARCAETPIRIGRVIALPEAYLRNFQPTDPRPPGPTPGEAAAAARLFFPGVRVGGGVLTHFTEFNRCRPDPSACDYVTHGTSAILHASDDRSVMESLEGLSWVFASARALAPGLEYHLGLVSIGMRTNPHGTEIAPNPRQVRLPAAGIDPRQRGLFAAAWAVGAVAATEGFQVSSMALAAPVGAFGIVHRRESWPQPIFDEDEQGGTRVRPLFHVVRTLARMDGAPRLSLDGLPSGVVGVAAGTESEFRLLLANVSESTRELALPRKAAVRRLDAGSFETAIGDPDWLRNGAPEIRSGIELEPLAVAFVDFSAAPA